MRRRLTRMTLLDLLVDLVLVSCVAAIAVPRASLVIGGRLSPCWSVAQTVPRWQLADPARAGRSGAWRFYVRILRSLTVEGRRTGLAQDQLFVCKVISTTPSPGGIDYRQSPMSLLGGYPVGRLTQPQWPISCDRVSGHDPNSVDDLNVLFFSGTQR